MRIVLQCIFLLKLINFHPKKTAVIVKMHIPDWGKPQLSDPVMFLLSHQSYRIAEEKKERKERKERKGRRKR